MYGRIILIGEPIKISERVNPLKLELQKIINKGKVEIDRSCFQKSDAEKEKLKTLKYNWKVNPGFKD